MAVRGTKDGSVCLLDALGPVRCGTRINDRRDGEELPVVMQPRRGSAARRGRSPPRFIAGRDPPIVFDLLNPSHASGE